MIHPYTDVKFCVSIDIPNTTIEQVVWTIKIINSFGTALSCISKEECLTDDEGKYYFVLHKVPKGRYIAITTITIPDSDCKDGTMQITDRQELCTVGIFGVPACGCNQEKQRPPMHGCHCDEPFRVTFKRVYTRDIDGATYLADCDGKLFLDANGKKIAIRKPAKKTT